MPVTLPDTPPFTAGRLALAHNGELEDFRESWLRDLRSRLDPRREAEITGCSDAVHVFALLRERLGDAAVSREALVRAMQQTVGELAADAPRRRRRTARARARPDPHVRVSQGSTPSAATAAATSRGAGRPAEANARAITCDDV